MTICARGLIRAVGPTIEANARIYALAFANDLPETFPLFWDASPYMYADYRPGNGTASPSVGDAMVKPVYPPDTPYLPAPHRLRSSLDAGA